MVLDLAEALGEADQRTLHHRSSIDFGDPSSAAQRVSGWWEPEAIPEKGLSWAWARGTAARVVLPLMHTRFSRLVFTGRPFHHPGAPPQTVAVSLNGRPLGVVTLEEETRGYALDLPPGLLRKGENVVDLTFDHALVPSAYGEGPDDRELSVAFFDLRLAGVWGEDPIPPQAAEPRQARVEGSDLVQPAGSELRYPTRIPPGAVLAFEIAASSAQASCSLAVEAGTRAPDGREDLFWSSPSSAIAAGRDLRIPVPGADGAPVELVLRVFDRRSGCGDAAPEVRWVRPRLLAGGSASQPEETAPDRTSNVVLIVVDTLRADRVGVYGGAAGTPEIDRLAAEGARFERTYSHIPITGPSHASMFTGLLPFQHGVHNNTQRLAAGMKTLAEVMRDSGRSTAAFVSLGVLKKKFGFGQGFDHYDDRFGSDWWRPSPEITDAALAWVQTHSERPLFLWVHYSDPHEPYAPLGLDYPVVVLERDGQEIGRLSADGRSASLPASVDPGVTRITLRAEGLPPGRQLVFRGWRARPARVQVAPLEGWDRMTRQFRDGRYLSGLPAAIAIRNPTGRRFDFSLRVTCHEDLDMETIRQRYRLEVENVDREIGRLLKGLEAAAPGRNTLVVFTADHGEGLGDHELLGHVSQLYDSLLRVPLILRFPGRVPAGVVVWKPAAHVDLLPTVLDALGMAPLPGTTGRSLLGGVTGDGDPRAPLVVETYRPEAPRDIRGIVAGGFKYILYPDDGSEELYDLVPDPSELDDVHAGNPDRVRALRAELETRLSKAGPQRAPDAVEVEEEDRQRLRDLGYLR